MPPRPRPIRSHRMKASYAYAGAGDMVTKTLGSWQRERWVWAVREAVPIVPECDPEMQASLGFFVGQLAVVALDDGAHTVVFW